MTNKPTSSPTVSPTVQIDEVAVKKQRAVVRAKKLRVAKQMHKIPKSEKMEGLYVQKQLFPNQYFPNGLKKKLNKGTRCYQKPKKRRNFTCALPSRLWWHRSAEDWGQGNSSNLRVDVRPCHVRQSNWPKGVASQSLHSYEKGCDLCFAVSHTNTDHALPD
jgi:hypothetical protein